MALRKFKPTSPGRRFMTVSTFEEVTRSKPEKSLTEPVKKTGGRNNYGRITTRHQGGGHKRRYRVIDFKRRKDGVPAKVAAIEYDPNRSARIAPRRFGFGRTCEMFTFSTCTSKSSSTACRICVLCAFLCTRNEYLRSAISE